MNEEDSWTIKPRLSQFVPVRKSVPFFLIPFSAYPVGPVIQHFLFLFFSPLSISCLIQFLEQQIYLKTLKISWPNLKQYNKIYKIGIKEYLIACTHSK